MTTNNKLDQESYFIELYYDAMYDDYCFYTIYRFETKEMCEEFVKEIETKYPNTIFDMGIGYEKERVISGYTENEPYRPRFSNLADALTDFKQMTKYCNNYWNMDKSTYTYSKNIFTEPLNDYQYKYLVRENEKLKKDNEKLKKEIEELNKVIEELNVVIKKYEINE